MNDKRENMNIHSLTFNSAPQHTCTDVRVPLSKVLKLRKGGVEQSTPDNT